MKPRTSAMLLLLILAASFILSLHRLDHASIKPLDEVFHAIVARNFLKHPLTPTLVDHPWLASDPRQWQSSHIWLHKPPMALWQIAISFAMFGVNTLALRLPSALLAAVAAGLTYCIGAELLDRAAGLIAAALQAFNPVIWMLVQGYVFSDHVDISLLFWSELAIFMLVRALRAGRQREAIFCGIAQGLAFLSKSYPALIVTGLAAAAWLLPRWGVAGKTGKRLTGRQFALIVAAFIAVAAPWMLYTAIRFPDAFAAENGLMLRHLDQNVEGWGAPWDRVLFGYWISIFYVFYPLILASVILLAIDAVRQKDLGRWLIVLCILGVLVPNLLATSKTMSATLIAWPTAWLACGALIARALRGGGAALGIWLAASALALALRAGAIPTSGWGGEAGSILRAHLWVVWQLLAALAVGAAMMRVKTSRWLAALPAALTLALLFRWQGGGPRGYVTMAWDVTRIHFEQTDFSAVAAFADRLPANAAFIVDERRPLDNKLLEFLADRSCYALDEKDLRTLAGQLAAAGAIPYFVTPRQLPLPMLFQDPAADERVYQLLRER